MLDEGLVAGRKIGLWEERQAYWIEDEDAHGLAGEKK